MLCSKVCSGPQIPDMPSVNIACRPSTGPTC
jgi:hypothetical protein